MLKISWHCLTRSPCLFARCCKRHVSCLYNSSDFFSPTVLPDPEFVWPDILHSIQARRLHHLEEEVRKLETMKNRLDHLDSTLSKSQQHLAGSNHAVSKTNLKAIKAEEKALRREFLHRFLQLPNTLHQECSTTMTNSVDVAEHDTPLMSSLPVSDPVKELHNMHMIVSHLHHKRKFIPISLSDIVRRPILHALNESEDQSICLEMGSESVRQGEKEDGGDLVDWFAAEHLVGSATLPAFLAYLMRCEVKMKCLPLRLITASRCYNWKGTAHTPFQQHNQIGILLAHSSPVILAEEVHKLEQSLLTILAPPSDASAEAGLRITRLYPPLLHVSEALRHEIGSADGKMATVSLYGDWLSRRLLIRSTNKKYLHLAYAIVSSAAVLTRIQT